MMPTVKAQISLLLQEDNKNIKTYNKGMSITLVIITGNKKAIAKPDETRYASFCLDKPIKTHPNATSTTILLSVI